MTKIRYDASFWKKARRLFRYISRRPDREWSDLLDHSCRGDIGLRKEVRALLAAHRDAGSFLEPPTIPSGSTASCWQGRRLGPYELIRRIGQGGMGVVYLATDRRSTKDRHRAIKLVRPGRRTAEACRRFRLEARWLGSLDHPNIAALIDSGTSEEGEPYLVMEYVDGRRIDVACDAEYSSLEERIQLFFGVCAAVDTMHRQHLVHRDLKPSNILVRHDGVPKVIDFGIAKLLGYEEDAPSGWFPTLTGLGPMTPDFASPEQIIGEPVTPASDIYALGVLLYILLTGRGPYPLGRSPLAMVRSICEIEPPRASRVVLHPSFPGGNRASPEELAARRRTTPGELAERLCGSLDTILSTALEKSPSRRYASVAALTHDLELYLAGCPILRRRSTKALHGNRPLWNRISRDDVVRCRSRTRQHMGPPRRCA